MTTALETAKQMISMAIGGLDRNGLTDRAAVLAQLAIASALVALVEHMEAKRIDDIKQAVVDRQLREAQL